MSNSRKLPTRKVSNTAGVSMYNAAQKLQGNPPADRRVKRALRRNRPLAADLMDHQKPHAPEENCGRSCAPFIRLGRNEGMSK